MKKKTKGIIVSAFFGIILLTSTITLALNSGPQQSPEEKITLTGTPEDNFPDLQRPRFCESTNAKSNQYVTEYKIPTKCTMPLAITADGQGNIWFVQTNTGNVAKFDPMSERFTEYQNPEWPSMSRTMSWGIDMSDDGHIWYTDDAHDTLWRFSTLDGSYEPMGFPASEDSLPQHVKITDTHVIVNDFYGGKISFLDLSADDTYMNVPSPIPGSFTGGFDTDSSGNVWYTNWMLRQGGALVKFDYSQFSGLTSVPDNSTALQFSDVFNLPPDLGTPVGLVVDDLDRIWIADTSSSSFFRFDPSTEQFTKYVTPNPEPSTYGNKTGVIRTPVSGPYWLEVDANRLVFNEQIGNAIAVFDIETESLVEYQVPSQNPNWADCAGAKDCGIAQVFGFASAGDKVWFTEWVENNIGVVDLAKQLPLSIHTPKSAVIPRGQSATIEMVIEPHTTSVAQVSSKSSTSFNDILTDLETQDLTLDGPRTVPVSIFASPSALPGEYKLVLSARANDVTVSQYVTVTVTQ